MADWIKLKEGCYPEPNVQVLVSDASHHVFICWHVHGFWRDFRVGNSRKEITHWQPLPEPPND